LVDNLYLTFYSFTMASGPENLINGLTGEIMGCPDGDPFCFGGGCSSHKREGSPQSGPIDPVRMRRKEMRIPEDEDDEENSQDFRSRVFSLPRSMYRGSGSEEMKVGDDL
jgi:hypothetical protein